MLFAIGDKVRYVGHAYQWLRGKEGVIQDITEAGFLYVIFPDSKAPNRKEPSRMRINPRFVEYIEED